MKPNGIEGLLERFENSDVSALARAISLVENARGNYEALLSRLHERVGRAHRIGLTGPPGAGKSTLAEGLVRAYRKKGLTVAVVAVDPTSPFSGGALLGDRIRMESVTLDVGVFIRSMATRGALGGLATTTREVCDVLDAFGFQRIIIETVGVGQSELAITGTADTAALVLVPESGDGIQVLKAGVMEVADAYAVNKADRPGAERLVQEVEVMLGIREGHAFRHVPPHHRPADAPTAEATSEAYRHEESSWAPPVLLTVAVNSEGVDELLDVFERHAAWLSATGELERRRRVRLAVHTREVVDRSLRNLVWRSGGGEAVLEGELEKVISGELSPYELADHIVAGFDRGTRHVG